MWPYWGFETIAQRSETFVHWCAIISAAIFALNVIFVVLLGVRYSNQRKRSNEFMGSADYMFWFPLTLTLAVLVGVPLGGIIGWYVGSFIGTTLSHFGILLVCVGTLTRIVRENTRRYRRLAAYTRSGVEQHTPTVHLSS